MSKVEFKNSISKYKKEVNKLPQNDAALAICAQEIILSYQLMETVFWELSCDPIPLLTEEIERLTVSFQKINLLYDKENFASRVMHNRESKNTIQNNVNDLDIKEITGRLYSSLFTKLSDRSYFDEATDLLKQRIEKNGVGYEWFKGKKGLDAGCGGGRYTVGLSQLGAAKMTGIDYGRDNIADAKRRVKNANIDCNLYF